MSEAGRPPVPTALKVLRGNPGKRPLNESEPKPKVGLPPAPREMPEAAKREWRRTGRKLERLGLLTELDLVAFEMYCRLYARWLEAEDRVRQHGMVIPTKTGYLQENPYLHIANRSQEQCRRMLSAFGMTPSSRSKVTAAEPEREEDPFEAFERKARRA